MFSDWKGVKYARQRTVPANPRTLEQQKTRTVFSTLNQIWRALTGDAPAAFRTGAQGRPLTDRNYFAQLNIPLLRPATDVSTIVLSPGTGGAPALETISGTTGANAGEITASATPAPAPPGWTLQRVAFYAIRNVDPHDPFTENIPVLTDSTSPYQVTFTGLQSGQQYVIVAFPVYTDTQGRTQYGPSKNTTATAA